MLLLVFTTGERASESLAEVDKSVVPLFRAAAAQLLQQVGDPEEALAMALAKVTGFSKIRVRTQYLTCHPQSIHTPIGYRCSDDPHMFTRFMMSSSLKHPSSKQPGYMYCTVMAIRHHELLRDDAQSAIVFTGSEWSWNSLYWNDLCTVVSRGARC